MQLLALLHVSGKSPDPSHSAEPSPCPGSHPPRAWRPGGLAGSHACVPGNAAVSTMAVSSPRRRSMMASSTASSYGPSWANESPSAAETLACNLSVSTVDEWYSRGRGRAADSQSCRLPGITIRSCAPPVYPIGAPATRVLHVGALAVHAGGVLPSSALWRPALEVLAAKVALNWSQAKNGSLVELGFSGVSNSMSGAGRRSA